MKATAMTASEQTTFDYVIVGAGSAGCVLANRLSADPEVRVCLIEAGPSDRGLLARFLVNVPAGIFSLITNPRYNWLYNYEADRRTGNREIFCPRGRILGGSSAINGMIYIRGHRADYDLWASQGADGWSYDDVLPYFRKSENWERGASPFHGSGGELNVADPRDPNPVCEAMLEAAGQLQYRRNEDFNGAEQDGFGYFQLTQKNGERMSTARAFLHPVRQRRNLTVVTNALARHIVLDGRRASGVAIRQDGRAVTLQARREVIVAAGAINSPQLLLLSGIGPGEELRRHGIAVRHELSGVGENLQDHQDILMCFNSPDARLYGISLRALPWMVKSPFLYLLARRGPWTTNTVEAGGFIRTLPNLPQPDIQLIFGPQLMNQIPIRPIPFGHGFSMHISLLQPKSRGRLTLISPKPEDAPRLSSRFLEHDDEVQTLVRGVKIVRQLVAAPAFDGYRGSEVLPGPAVGSDRDIAEFVRNNVMTTFHPAGTCKMGRDAMAVVDPELRVHGIEGLRVVDASVMPVVISGNTNAPVIMIAEKGADMIRRQWAH